MKNKKNSKVAEGKEQQKCPLVRWHFSLIAKKRKNSPENKINKKQLNNNYSLLIHGINTEDGIEQTFVFCRLSDDRTLIAAGTDNGTNYQCQLKGQLDKKAALREGFQPDLISEFSDGFPHNCIELLNQHIQKNLEGKEQQTKINLVRWQLHFKTADNQLEGIFPDFSLFLSGILTENGNYWISSPVDQVLAHDMIKAGAHTYKLIGSIDQEESRKAGFSDNFIHAFERGFPDDWEQLILNYVKCMKQNFVRKILLNLHETAEKEKFEALENNEPNHPIVEEIFDDSQSFHTLGLISAENSAAIVESPLEVMESKTQAKQKAKRRTKSLAVEETENSSAIDESQMVTPAFQFKSTSRGRVIKPRIDNWLGERLVYDVDGNLIETRCATTMRVGQDSSKLLAIASHCGVKKIEASKQFTLVPLANSATKNGATKKRTKREMSVDSYTKRLDQLEMSGLEDGIETELNEKNVNNDVEEQAEEKPLIEKPPKDHQSKKQIKEQIKETDGIKVEGNAMNKGQKKRKKSPVPKEVPKKKKKGNDDGVNAEKATTIGQKKRKKSPASKAELKKEKAEFVETKSEEASTKGQKKRKKSPAPKEKLKKTGIGNEITAEKAIIGQKKRKNSAASKEVPKKKMKGNDDEAITTGLKKRNKSPAKKEELKISKGKTEKKQTTEELTLNYKYSLRSRKP